MYDPSKVELLIVDDDNEFRGTVVRRFERRGFRVRDAASAEDALELIGRQEFDVAIVDMVMPGLSGLELLERLREQRVAFEVILLTGQGTIESAVQAMKAGAYDYLTKPFPLTELELLIHKAYERRELRKENRQLKAMIKRATPARNIVGESEAMQDVFRLIERAGPSDRSILILGESGTGKELVARALHHHSPRADKQLVIVNCAALSESLLESELFGHEKGAFTGATATKDGLFEIADSGTLFIDEIGEMPATMQAKLLRVLEDGSFSRVGSSKVRRVDIRLLAATNRDLTDDVAAGRFREDLYYRIDVMSIRLPPLRDRTGDIPLLVNRFLGDDWTIDDDALACLESFHWPGNVRQLINIIERARILADDWVIHKDDLPDEIVNNSLTPATERPGGGESLADIEKGRIIQVLHQEHGNKTRTARALGITRRSLYRLLEKYAIQFEPASPTR
ncbi:MAG: two-component system response regulator [Planctomycetaceae bacterium]|nr:two-component system response regulator [Planctomycetaceae bacterium]MDP7275064.1 sigma-54 dependent transcriptional regulator [Planctomycetaceae bacterium]